MYETLQSVIYSPISNRRMGAALLLLRVFVGIAFIQHGSGKLMHPSEFAVEFGIPIWLALATMLVQLSCGTLLILGALTPLAALGIAGTMLTATIFLINRGERFINTVGHSWENSAFYLMASICLVLSGAGPWSLDAWVFGRRNDSPVVDASRVARTTSR